MAGFSKRLPFKRAGTAAGPDDMVTVAETSSTEDQKVNSGNASGSNTDIELEANHELLEIEAKHKFDPNMPDDLVGEIDAAAGTHDAKVELTMLGEITEDSIYPEVRAACRPASEMAIRYTRG